MRGAGAIELGAILETLRRGRCVLCLGGGLTSDGSLKRLMERLLDGLPDSAHGRALLDSRPLLAADYLRRSLGAGFGAALLSATESAGLAKPLALLGTLPFSAVVTTSFDADVVRAFARSGALPPVVSPRDPASARGSRRSRFIFRLFGDAAREESLVWGAHDLQSALLAGGYRVITDELLRTHSFLLLGFEWSDPELHLLLERIFGSVARSSVEHFAVLSGTSAFERDQLYASWGIRVIADLDVATVAHVLHASSDPQGTLPEEDDLEGLLNLLADDPDRPDALDRLDALEDRLRQAHDSERLVELCVSRTRVERDSGRRAEMLREAARVLDEELGDAKRALTALLAAYQERPRRESWETLERLAAQCGEWSELAGELMARIPELPMPDRPDAWARVAAIRDEELGDTAGALAAARAALALEPEHREATEQRLSVLRKSGRWQELAEALGHCLLAEQSVARKVEIYRTLAEVFEERLDDPLQAIGCYRLALEADPSSEEVRAQLEALLLRRGEIADLVQLIEAQADRAAAPARAGLLRRVATLCEQRLGDRRLGIEKWEEVRALAPDDPEAIEALERLYEAEGRTRDVLELLGDAVVRTRSERERLRMHRRLAAQWERQPGGLQTAGEHLEALLAITPDDAEALSGLERLYRTGGQLRQLRDVLERHAAIAPPAEQLPLLLTRAALESQELGEPERARATYLEALRRDPLHLEALHRAAELAGERLGDAAGAEALYERALAVDPAHVPSLFGLAQLYRRQGDYLRSARRLTDAVAHTDNRLERARLLVEAGDSHERLEDPARAIALYLQVLETDPEHIDAATRAAELLWRAERYAELVPILEMLIRKESPEAPRVELLTRLAVAARAGGDSERATRAFTRVLELEPNHRQALQALGELCLARRAFADARALWERLLQHHEAALTPGEQVELHHQIGVCDLELGRPHEARERFTLACAIDPTHRPSRLRQLELGEHDPLALIEAKKALLPTAGPAERVKLLIEIGDLYLDRLEDPVQAAGAWQAGLRVQPDDVQLLHRCLNVFVEQKAWTQALEVLAHLIGSASTARVRASYHYTAGIIQLEHLGRFAEAADHLWASVEGAPEKKRAHTALEQMLRNHKSWTELARYYQFAIQKLEPFDSDEKRAEQLRLWSALADVYEERLRDAESALVAFKVAAALDPSPKRRQKLATLYTLAGPQHLQAALEEHQNLLRGDKARIASYRALKELYGQAGQAARAEACAHALACLKPDEEAPPLADAPPSQPRRPLRPEAWAKLRHPLEDARLSALFAAVAPVIAAARAQRERQPLRRKRLLSADDPRPAARWLERAALHFGQPVPAAYADPGQREAASLVCTVDGQVVTPVLVLGRALLDEARPARELAFEIGRRVAELRPEYLIRWLLPLPRELAHLIEAAIALTDEASGRTVGGELAKTIAGYRQALSPVVLDQVLGLAHRLRSAALDPEAAALRWLQSTDLTCARAGYLLSEDLRACARLLKHDAAPPTALPAPQRILELVWSSVTEEMADARAL